MAPKPAAKKKGKEEEATPPPPTTGTGKFFWKSGATYEGEWVAAPPVVLEGQENKPADPDAPVPIKRLRHGKGNYQEGDYSYEGEWENDQMHGQGKFSYASGAVYEGQWQGGKYQGQGQYTWPDGRKYVGDWENNKMHGQGTFTDVEGHEWCGQFFNGSGPGLTCKV